MSDWSVTNNAWIQIWRVIIDKIGLTATFAALPPQFRGWLSVVVITLLARLVTKKEEQIFQFQFLQLYSTNWQDNAFKVTLNGAQWAEGSARPALGLIGGPPQFRHRGSKSKNSKKNFEFFCEIPSHRHFFEVISYRSEIRSVLQFTYVMSSNFWQLSSFLNILSRTLASKTSDKIEGSVFKINLFRGISL